MDGITPSETFIKSLGTHSIAQTIFFPLLLDFYIQTLLGRKKHVLEYFSAFTFIVAIESAKDELECYLAICEVSTFKIPVGILEKYFFQRLSCQFRFFCSPFYVLMLEIR